MNNCSNCKYLVSGMGTEGHNSKTSYWDCQKNPSVSFRLQYSKKWGKWTADYEQGPEHFTCDQWEEKKVKIINDHNFRRV